MSEDRRAEPRTRISRKAFVSDTDARFYYYCFIREASRGGCRLYSPDASDLPETLWLYPETFKTPMLGRIAWRGHGMAGVEFIARLPGGAGKPRWQGEAPTFDTIGQQIQDRRVSLRGTSRPDGAGPGEADMAADRKPKPASPSGYLAAVVHELKTPITSIMGALSLVVANALEALPEKFQHLIEIALRNTKRMQALVGDLLDAEKLGRGKIVIQMEPGDVNLIARESVELDGQFAAMHDITLRLEVSPEPAMAKIDAERMKQVLSNLISNAVKFSSAGQEVVVRVERAGARIRVSVIDSGAGIAKEAHARIFNEFEQAGEAGGELQKGTGLGLTICRSIVQLHGSKIGLESEPGRGSTFYFDLHAIAGDGAQRAKAA